MQSKKEPTKKLAARNTRLNLNVKSRATISTDSSSEDEETTTPKKNVQSNPRLPIVSPKFTIPNKINEKTPNFTSPHSRDE